MMGDDLQSSTSTTPPWGYQQVGELRQWLPGHGNHGDHGQEVIWSFEKGAIRPSSYLFVSFRIFLFLFDSFCIFWYLLYDLLVSLLLSFGPCCLHLSSSCLILKYLQWFSTLGAVGAAKIACHGKIWPLTKNKRVWNYLHKAMPAGDVIV